MMQHETDFAEFIAVLGDSLGIDVTASTPETRLVEDLGFDSLAYFEMLSLLEDVADRQIDDGVVDTITTVGDLHGWWRQFSLPEGT
jgi:acyl carrier protein